jgi:catechol 2,3-dioxygenase-like lactoylglutathione lyase family enzyme
MEGSVQQKFNVSGVLLDRPFKIRRLGHFGFNVQDVEECLHFYGNLLGFSIADPIDFGARIKDEEVRKTLGSGVGYFMRHGSDHHSFVLFPKKVLDELGGRSGRADVTVNQITWQVGSLREVTGAEEWLRGMENPIRRSGRDTPGSNWHVYPFDPDENINELYYGIEQIGWDGHSKPAIFRKRGFQQTPELPQISEYDEVQAALAEGADLKSGTRHIWDLESKYDVGGILLPRPFKIVRIGPVRLFVDDIESSLSFYKNRLGMTVTEEISWNGHRCVFLRVNTEHHSMALYPKALRSELGLSEHTACMSFGLQLAGYDQLRNGMEFLKENGVKIIHLPPELFPGIDYSAFALDPDGHALQLYYYMEQIGWDGKPRPSGRKVQTSEEWPEAVEPHGDSFGGEPFLGPLG